MSAALSLHEVVDELDGRSVVEELDLPPCWIVSAVQRNEQAYTAVRTIGRTLYVKESPDEILQKIKVKVQENPNTYVAVDFRIYQDMEKAILVDMNLIKSVSSLTRFQTEFKHKRGDAFIVRIPLEWLNVPENKIKKTRKVSAYAPDL